MNFEQIITLLPENYQQQGFNINPFINTAQNLAGNHPVVLDAVNCLNNLGIDINAFNRGHLVHIYQEEEIPFYVKIAITFWWGGIGHAYQAPGFYTQENLDSIQNFSTDLYKGLTRLSEVVDVELFEQLFGELYNALKLPGGAFNMAQINTSFFTKIFQFFFCANPPTYNTNFIPIIADKWSKKAVLCDMMHQGFHWQEIFNIPNNVQNAPGFIGNNAQEFEMYWEFITYYNHRAQELVQQEIVESACHLEGLLFGWARDIQNLQNPRFHYNHCLREYINGLADVNNH